MAETVAAVVAVYGANEARKGRKAQNKAQEEAADLERGRASLENRQKRLRALAQARRQRAQLISQGFNQGTGSNSAVQGAAGALTTDTANQIGAANTQLAARTGQSLILQAGASQAVKYANRAGYASAIGSIATGFSDFKGFGKKDDPLVTPTGVE